MPTVRRSDRRGDKLSGGQLKELDDDLRDASAGESAVAGAGGAAEECTWHRSRDHHQPAGGSTGVGNP